MQKRNRSKSGSFLRKEPRRVCAAHGANKSKFVFRRDKCDALEMRLNRGYKVKHE